MTSTRLSSAWPADKFIYSRPDSSVIISVISFPSPGTEPIVTLDIRDGNGVAVETIQTRTPDWSATIATEDFELNSALLDLYSVVRNQTVHGEDIIKRIIEELGGDSKS